MALPPRIASLLQGATGARELSFKRTPAARGGRDARVTPPTRRP